MDENFFLKKIEATRTCVFKKVRKKYVYITDFILKTMVDFRPGFQDECTLMFAKMFLWVHSLFQKIPKWFAFFTCLM